MRPFLYALTGMLLGLLVLGCGGGPTKYQTRGRILKNGEPYHAPEGEFIRVTLMPIAEEGSRALNWYAANYDPEDGTFTAAGADGNGVPPGKYRIGIEQLRNRNDVLKGAFFEKSPFVREIRSSSDQITVDLAKKE